MKNPICLLTIAFLINIFTYQTYASAFPLLQGTETVMESKTNLTKADKAITSSIPQKNSVHVFHVRNRVTKEYCQIILLVSCCLLICLIFYRSHTLVKKQRWKFEDKERLYQKDLKKIKHKKEELNKIHPDIKIEDVKHLSLQKEIADKQKKLKQAERDMQQLIKDYQVLKNENLLQLTKMEQKIENQLTINKNLTDEVDKLRNTLITKEHILNALFVTNERWKKYLISHNEYLNNLVEQEPFVFDEKDWLKFRENFNWIFPEFILHLTQKFPNMSETEINTCCLVKLNVRTYKIAAFFNQEKNTISKRKKAILTTYFSSFQAKSLDELLRYYY